MERLIQGFLIALALSLLLFALYFEITNRYRAPILSNPQHVFADQNELWDLVQEFRASRGLKSFIKSDKLCEIASIRAPEVEIEQNHVGFRRYIAVNGYSGYAELGENILWNEYPEKSCPATDGIMAWNNSESHHQALVREDWTHACVRCVRCACSLIFAR